MAINDFVAAVISTAFVSCLSMDIVMNISSILNVAQKRMQLLWVLAFIIIIVVPVWILVQQTIPNSSETIPNFSEFQQQVRNRTRIINFREAKRAMYELYSDHRITFYCGCDLTASHSINLAGCGMPALQVK
ncbi:membrane protein [Candidatus Thiomargarita nelsonii]|uniref:Membrane protein n=1 Tax=Candidatus Thiomargarita nelsonii TaxID=1003181 RepID=A0A176S649_9GAMM|nr:membrane protein [Candidatus Thiomargarita nelsonii]